MILTILPSSRFLYELCHKKNILPNLSLFIDIYAINCDKSSTKYITYQIESSLSLVGEDTLRERILFDILA